MFRCARVGPGVLIFLQDYGIERLPKDQRDGTAVLAGKTLEGSAGLPVGVQVRTKPSHGVLGAKGFAKYTSIFLKSCMLFDWEKSLRVVIRGIRGYIRQNLVLGQI